MRFDAHRSLIVYAGVVTTPLAVLLVTAALRPKLSRFEEIDVQRINLREPDGTLRMTIFSAARAPGMIVKGHEYRHPTRQSAGLLFFNDEGTENGGLIFVAVRQTAALPAVAASLSTATTRTRWCSSLEPKKAVSAWLD